MVRTLICMSARMLLPALAWLGLSGCAAMYFHDTEAPASIPRYGLDHWPYREYWTGIIFVGDKVGFTHLTLASAGAGNFRVDSQAVLRFRFLALDKSVNLRSRDWVGPDLQLQRFDYDYNLDGNRLRIRGRRDGDLLVTRLQTGGRETEQTISVDGPLYPTSAIPLYPVLHGLEVGRRFEYMVYDGETQRVGRVRQEIVGYETSELYEGPAYKIETTLYDNTVRTWISPDGRPVLEMSAGGVLIAGIETPERARRYLALAALNKEETLLDFSRVPTDPPIAAPRQVRRLTVTLYGLGDFKPLVDDNVQRCRRRAATLVCTVTPTGGPAVDPGTEALAPYREPSLTVPHVHPEFARLAGEITAGAPTTEERIRALVNWIQAQVAREAVDVFSALDVLKRRKAECQGHSYLYAAFARALDIPTRLVNGLVYSGRHDGFLYHTWTESWVDGRWLPVDPTFGQVPADATHIKLVEGENLADLAPLLPLIGRLRIRVDRIEPPPPGWPLAPRDPHGD